MSVVGIDRVYLGVQDADGNILTDENTGFTTGMIEVTDEMLGTSSVNFQTSKNGEELDGNNKQLDFIKAMPTASMDISFNNLPFDVINKVLGREKAGVGYVDSMANTYSIVIARSPLPDMKHYVYTCMGKAVATSKGKNMATNTSKKTNRVNDELSFEGLSCSRTNDMPYITACDEDDGFTQKALFDQLCPGQTLITAPVKASVPASTGSSSTSQGK